MVLLIIVSTLNFTSGGHIEKISPEVTEKFSSTNTLKADIYFTDPQNGSILDPNKRTQLINTLNNEQIIHVYDEAITANISFNDLVTLSQQSEVTHIVPHIVLHKSLNESVVIIDADQIWQEQVNETHLTGEGKSICVIDTGVDFNHQDLQAKNIAGANFDCNAGSDCPIDPNATDTDSHGTHVAGIAAAQGNVNGVAKGANIVSMKVFQDGSNVTSPLKIKRAVEACVEKAPLYDIAVITISVASVNVYQEYCDTSYIPLTQAIENANANLIPVTISSGNEHSSDAISFPSCISSSIPVAATNKDDTLAVYSNYNSLVKLFAPGTAVYSTCLNDNYCYKSGTSMSAPMVAGAITILRQKFELTNHIFTPQAIEQLLFESGEPILNLPEDFRINVYNAVISSIPEEDLSDDWFVDASDLSILLGSWGECPQEGECPADFNNDGIVGASDLAQLLGAWGQITQPEDFNGDGAVDSLDLSLLLAAWGENQGHPADLNTDGLVNEADLAIFLGSWE